MDERVSQGGSRHPLLDLVTWGYRVDWTKMTESNEGRETLCQLGQRSRRKHLHRLNPEIGYSLNDEVTLQFPWGGRAKTSER